MLIAVPEPKAPAGGPGGGGDMYCRPHRLNPIAAPLRHPPGRGLRRAARGRPGRRRGRAYSESWSTAASSKTTACSPACPSALSMKTIRAAPSGTVAMTLNRSQRPPDGQGGSGFALAVGCAPSPVPPDAEAAAVAAPGITDAQTEQRYFWPG